ncbi:DUF1803 domain-containing protein [Enterococcus faecalis]
MAKITYFYAEDNKQSSAAFLQLPLFHRLVEFFLKHEGQRIILRKLKAAFPEADSLDQLVENLVSAKLLIRNDRNYQLAFPIYTEEQVLLLPKVRTSDLASLKLIANAKGSLFLGEILWYYFFEKTPTYFFGLTADAANHYPCYERQEFANDDLSFVSISKKGQEPLTLPNYFNQLTRNDQNPIFTNLLEHIGDVNPSYFMQQAKRIIKQAQKHRSVSQKPNIFLESLLTTGIVKVIDGSLCMNVPNERRAEVQLWRSAFEETMASIFHFEKQQQLNQHQQILFRTQLFAELMTASEQETFAYILFG